MVEGYKHWTKEKTDQLRSLINEGKKHSEIAAIFGVDITIINNHASRNKIRSKAPRTKWSNEDLGKLKQLIECGKSHSEIAVTLNTKKSRVAKAASKFGIKSKFVANVGELNPNWKGDAVGYAGIHVWVRHHIKKPNACQKCGKVTTSLEIHRIPQEYKRELSGWIYLCKSCHTKEEFEKRVQAEVERRLKHG